jgi:tetratricopeptide (TPR) repeat protein
MKTRHWLFLALVCIGAATTGCSERKCQEVNGVEPPPVDAKLMAFLSRARAAHHEADLFESDPARALPPLDRLVSGPKPDFDGTPLAEVREVLADTHARVADLESQLGRYESAHRRLNDALGLVPEMSYFRGHLFETRGLVHQREAETLRRDGQPQAAETAKTKAIEAFETAMEIQAQVIHSTPISPSSGSSPLGSHSAQPGLGPRPLTTSTEHE